MNRVEAPLSTRRVHGNPCTEALYVSKPSSPCAVAAHDSRFSPSRTSAGMSEVGTDLVSCRSVVFDVEAVPSTTDFPLSPVPSGGCSAPCEGCSGMEAGGLPSPPPVHGDGLTRFPDGCQGCAGSRVSRARRTACSTNTCPDPSGSCASSAKAAGARGPWGQRLCASRPGPGGRRLPCQASACRRAAGCHATRPSAPWLPAPWAWGRRCQTLQAAAAGWPAT